MERMPGHELGVAVGQDDIRNQMKAKAKNQQSYGLGVDVGRPRRNLRRDEEVAGRASLRRGT
jgi:hypothetical protein